MVILVHGSLDRGASFARTMTRLPEWGLVTYDRRGYQDSRPAGVAEHFLVHAQDLLSVASAYAALGGPLCAVGHSVGGTVVLGAALADPGRFSSIGAYEPSLPWLGFHRPRPDLVAAARGTSSAAGAPGEPGAGRTGGAARSDAESRAAEEAERFFRRMVGSAAWERLPESARNSRRDDGPALLADLTGIRSGTLFDVTRLATPAVFGSGGSASFPHHRQTVDWLLEHVPGAHRCQIPDAGHGAHLSHPDAFATFARQVVALAPA